MDRSIEAEMLRLVPNLRAFAVSLTADLEKADDLVQETLLRGLTHIDRFEAGTNLQAWLFTILRNGFHSQHRKKRREVEDPDGSYAARLWAPPEQPARCAVQDMLKALAKLPVEHREALLLIVAEGLSYEDAARVCGVPVGTMKSRTFRARMHLAELLAVEDAETFGVDQVTQAALQHAI